MARMGFPGRVSSNAPNSLLPKQLRGFMARLQYLRRKRGQLLNLRVLRMLRCRWHKARAEVQPRNQHLYGESAFFALVTFAALESACGVTLSIATRR